MDGILAGYDTTKMKFRHSTIIIHDSMRSATTTPAATLYIEFQQLYIPSDSRSLLSSYIQFIQYNIFLPNLVIC
jgi:hypothetical protein